MENKLPKLQPDFRRLMLAILFVGLPLTGQEQIAVPIPGQLSFTVNPRINLVNLNVRQPRRSFHLAMPNRRQFRKLLLVAAGAYLTHRWDSEIDEDYALEGDEFLFQSLRWYGKVGELYDSQLTYPIMVLAGAVFYGYGRLSNDPIPGETIQVTLKAIAWTSIITFILKAAIGRYRPYANKGPYQTEFLDFYLKAKYHSFPSGHTSSIFALATVFAERTASRTTSWLAYGLAASVGFQRMMDRKHWASDVIAGALIGHLMGSWVIRKERSSRENLYLSPYADGKTVGVVFNF